MHHPLVFLDEFGRDVPAAVVAGWGFFVTSIAIKRSAVKKLLEPGSILRIEITRIAGKGELVSAAVAAPGVEST
jgi:hypothetical protein